MARIQPLWLFIFSLACVATGLAGYLLLRLPAPNHNRLAVGDLASVDAVNIEIQAPLELDFKTRAEVLAIRVDAVQRHADLLAEPYRPAETVFGQITDHLPWWGLAGYFYYGPGERSIEGPAEESRFLANPYLLLGLDLYHDWKSRPESDILRPGFGLDCPPVSLAWKPRERRAETVYQAACVARTNSRFFDLIAYNARDMNLNYLYVSYADSLNVSKLDPPSGPYAIPHYLHRGGSCGYPGGCNNMSPPTPEIDGLEIAAFPAELVARLWRARPSGVDQAPDMVFVIRIQ